MLIASNVQTTLTKHCRGFKGMNSKLPKGKSTRYESHVDSIVIEISFWIGLSNNYHQFLVLVSIPSNIECNGYMMD